MGNVRSSNTDRPSYERRFTSKERKLAALTGGLGFGFGTLAWDRIVDLLCMILCNGR